MKNLIAFLIISTSFTRLSAQVQICLGQDVSVCQGQSVQITNCPTSGGSQIPGIYLPAPTNVALSDDQWSGAINIGFPFSFHGVTYNQLVIGSNGLISFNLANAGGYCPWSTNGAGPLPNMTLTGAMNSAMIYYGDLNPANANSGPVQYQMIGTAPNRMFVVNYNGVTMYSCTNQCTTGAIIIYEGSNIIDMQISSKPICNSNWNGNLNIQAVENTAGTVAVPIPGRNNQVYNVVFDGKRFNPISATNTAAYTQSTIPFAPVNAPSNALQWTNNLNQTFPYNNGVLNITSVLPGVTGYWLIGQSCGVSTGPASDTSFITRVNVSATATATTDYCASGNGTATVTPSANAGVCTFQWNAAAGNQTTATATNLVAGAYSCVVTSAAGCTATVNVTVPNTTATFAGTTTLVSCPGGSNGTATAEMTPVQGTVSYLWDAAAGNQTSATAINLAAGAYSCVVTSSLGCVGTVNVTVTEIPGMIAALLSSQDVTCNSGNNGVATMSITQGTAPYSYVWAGSAQNSASVNDLFAGNQTLVITDANNCVIPFSLTINEPPALTISSLSQGALICPENNTTLTVTGAGGSSPYTFTWTENGSVIGTGASIIVDPSVPITNYCVTLTELCGSPSDDSCLTLTFPTPITPSLSPNVSWSCEPGSFEFTNTSGNKSETATLKVDFSDGSSEMFTNTNNFFHTFGTQGAYSVDLTVTSIHGCVYTANQPSIVNVIANPIAEFNFSANPTTIFETQLDLQDKSSGNVVSWEWYSPFSVPSTSTDNNPSFKFPDGIVATYPVQLIVTTPEGCIDTVENILSVMPDVIFFAPNAFTPDGDEHNQTWKFVVQGIDVYDFNLLIFNRWGEIIWETNDVNAEWDGTYKGEIIQAGAYTWVSRVKDFNTDKKREFNGSINIIR